MSRRIVKLEIPYTDWFVETRAPFRDSSTMKVRLNEKQAEEIRSCGHPLNTSIEIKLEFEVPEKKATITESDIDRALEEYPNQNKYMNLGDHLKNSFFGDKR